MPHFEGDFVNPSYGNHTCHRYSDLMYLVRGEQLHRLLQPSPQAGRGWCSRLQTSLKKNIAVMVHMVKVTRLSQQARSLTVFSTAACCKCEWLQVVSVSRVSGGPWTCMRRRRHYMFKSCKGRTPKSECMKPEALAVVSTERNRSLVILSRFPPRRGKL